MKTQRIFLFLLIAAILLAISPTFGQGDTPTPDVATLEPTITPTPVIVEPPPPNPIPDDIPDELPVTTPEILLGQLYSLLKDATYMVWAAAGVIVIVGFIKVLAAGAGFTITGGSAVALTLIIQVLIWAGYAVANYLNQGEAFKVWYLYIVDAVRSLAPLFGAIFLGHVGFKAAQARGVPVAGYSAPKKPNDSRSGMIRPDTVYGPPGSLG